MKIAFPFEQRRVFHTHAQPEPLATWKIDQHETIPLHTHRSERAKKTAKHWFGYFRLQTLTTNDAINAECSECLVDFVKTFVAVSLLSRLLFFDVVFLPASHLSSVVQINIFEWKLFCVRHNNQRSNTKRIRWPGAPAYNKYPGAYVRFVWRALMIY